MKVATSKVSHYIATTVLAGLVLVSIGCTGVFVDPDGVDHACDLVDFEGWYSNNLELIHSETRECPVEFPGVGEPVWTSGLVADHDADPYDGSGGTGEYTVAVVKNGGTEDPLVENTAWFKTTTYYVSWSNQDTAWAADHTVNFDAGTGSDQMRDYVYYSFEHSCWNQCDSWFGPWAKERIDWSATDGGGGGKL